MIQEPDFKKNQKPEDVLQKSIVDCISHKMKQTDVKYILLEKFGFDIGMFINNKNIYYFKSFEIKAFVGQRMGGIGFGNQKGKGPQVDLLILPLEKLKFVRPMVRWIIGNGLFPLGSPRYVFLDSEKAKNSAMREVARNKQNNFRMSAFENSYITWNQLCKEIENFLLNSF